MSENTEASSRQLDFLVSCRSCWWQEGGLCYFGEPQRDTTGRSVIKADAACEHHKAKRRFLEDLGLSTDKLIIASEHTGN